MDSFQMEKENTFMAWVDELLIILSGFCIPFQKYKTHMNKAKCRL